MKITWWQNFSTYQIQRSEWRRYWGDFVEAARKCGDWPEESIHGDVSYGWQKDYMHFMYDLMDTNGMYRQNIRKLKLCWGGLSYSYIRVVGAGTRLSQRHDMQLSLHHSV